MGGFATPRGSFLPYGCDVFQKRRWETSCLQPYYKPHWHIHTSAWTALIEKTVAGKSHAAARSLRKEKRKENEDGTGEGLFVGVGGDFRMRMVYMCMCVAEGGGECQGCKS